jgi:prepilin-type N-terminal cleavage/methylation domain-containing protein
MMNNTYKRGFTLIELLVVIAIIGILASVVLASLNTARDKGADAAAKSSMNNARAQSELYYDNNGRTYTTVCLSGTNNISQLMTAAGQAVGATVACADDAAGWGAQVLLKSGQYYCVDSTGKATTTVVTNGITEGSDYACN